MTVTANNWKPPNPPSGAGWQNVVYSYAGCYREARLGKSKCVNNSANNKNMPEETNCLRI